MNQGVNGIGRLRKQAVQSIKEGYLAHTPCALAETACSLDLGLFKLLPPFI